MAFTASDYPKIEASIAAQFKNNTQASMAALKSAVVTALSSGALNAFVDDFATKLGIGGISSTWTETNQGEYNQLRNLMHTMGIDDPDGRLADFRAAVTWTPEST